MTGLATIIHAATIVDGKALLESAVASLVAGVGVTAAASTAIYGFATFADARRDERMGAALAGAAIGVVASVVFTGAIVVGLVVMIG